MQVWLRGVPSVGRANVGRSVQQIGVVVIAGESVLWLQNGNVAERGAAMMGVSPLDASYGFWSLSVKDPMYVLAPDQGARFVVLSCLVSSHPFYR